MPKLKTHKGAAKRLRVTGTGKIKRSKAYHRHDFWAKTPKQDRRLRHAALVSSGDYKRYRKLIADAF